MRSTDQKFAKETNDKSVFRFLARFGIGAMFGWLRGLFRANPRHPQQAPPEPVKVYVTGTPSEAPLAHVTGVNTAELNVEPVQLLPIQPTLDDAPAPQPLSTHGTNSQSEIAVDLEPQRESDHSSDVTASVVHEDVGQEAPAVLDDRTVPTHEALLSDPPATGPVGLIPADTRLQDTDDHVSATSVPSDSPQVVDSENVQGVHEPPTRTAIHRPRPVESPQEYLGSVFDGLPPEYLLWNRWLAEQVFAPTRRDEEVYLSITPTILAGIAADYSGSPMLPQDAEAGFTAALRAAYVSISACDGRLRVLRRFDQEGLPLCLAFLGVSVLAAYKMQSDEEVSGGAYYFRLAEILASDMVAGHPRGFDPSVFESLWVFVQKWLAAKTGANLVMPSPEVRRFVALPLTHVPLRRLDIEKLPTFFVWAGYTPGVRISETKLLFDLERWVRSYASFSSAGTSAVMDDRRHAVIAQVLHELAAWDGSVTESGGCRSASVQLMLDIVRQRPDLFYLPRRPDGFPAHFDDGVHVFEAADDGWYAPLQLTGDNGLELSDGFEWKGVGNVSLRRGPAAVVALGPSPDYTGFLSRSNLLRGTTCAVLCEEAIVPTAADYLGASVGRSCAAISHPSLPRGWRLFPNVRPTHQVAVPAGLDALSLASDVEIICTGGLRLGRRREWLAGAPPKIIVTGLQENEIVSVDGEPVNASEDGVLQTNGHLLGPGVHVIDTGHVQRAIEIVEPRMGAPRASRGFDQHRHYVTLPAGQWYVIGAEPDQTTGLIAAGRPGKICEINFDPVWAISVGGGPGAAVICIPRVPPPPAVQANHKLAPTPCLQQWVSVIYNAAIRRPMFASLIPKSDPTPIGEVWRQYAKLARRIKRQWRSDR